MWRKRELVAQRVVIAARLVYEFFSFLFTCFSFFLFGCFLPPIALLIWACTVGFFFFVWLRCHYMTFAFFYPKLWMRAVGVWKKWKGVAWGAHDGLRFQIGRCTFGVVRTGLHKGCFLVFVLLARGCTICVHCVLRLLSSAPLCFDRRRVMFVGIAQNKRDRVHVELVARNPCCSISTKYASVACCTVRSTFILLTYIYFFLSLFILRLCCACAQLVYVPLSSIV